ncbi:MAG: nuclear transport factor 2 family protein [Vicinamibacterales bacterium]
MKGIVTIVLCLLSAAGGAVFVHAQQKKSIATDDFVEIQRLLYANHTGYDFAVRDNGDLWTSTFTPDAVLDNGPNTHLVGETAIRAYAAGPAAKAPSRKFRHWTSTFHVTPNAEGAILSAFYLIVSDGEGNGPMTVGATGRYESQVVKTKQGWKIKHHVVYGEGSAVARTAAMQAPGPGAR